MITKEDIAALNARFKDASPEEVLAYCLKAFQDRIALSSSLSIEDQALTKMIVDIDKSTRIFTLDTGRLFLETYQLIDRTNLTYNIKIEVFFPDYREVQRMVREEGINLFYNSIESRHRCCAIRKLEPLKRAFQGLGLDLWPASRAERHEKGHAAHRVGRPARHGEDQSADQLDGAAGARLYSSAPRALQQTLRQGLSQHRL